MRKRERGGGGGGVSGLCIMVHSQAYQGSHPLVSQQQTKKEEKKRKQETERKRVQIKRLSYNINLQCR